MDIQKKGPITIPEKGVAPQELLAAMEAMRDGDMDWKAGKTWSMVYYVDEAHLDLQKKAYELFFSENYLNPFAFKSVQRMEREIIDMAAALLNGDGATVGTMTSGGTESIFMAMYTYRDRARQEKKGGAEPEVVVPSTIHPAFEKAAHILGMRLVKVPIGRDLCADVEAMTAAITSKTILLAASAPAFPYGMVDNIAALAAMASDRGIPLHVDACVGGFMLPWVERLGREVPVWDFRVPGVTSISADLHKFGYGVKGASLILYRSMDYLKYQFFISTDWCGGIYVSPTFRGTRPAGPIAAGWASMKALGEDGYLAVADRILKGVDELRNAISAIPELEVLGHPHMNVLAFRTIGNKPDIFVVGDQLQDKGWMVDRQQNPNSIHLMVMSHNLPVMGNYLRDLQEAVAYARANPRAAARGNAALYGLMTRIPFRGMVERNVRQIFEDLYGASQPSGKKDQQQQEDGAEGVSLPESPLWMGLLNRILVFWGRLRRRR